MSVLMYQGLKGGGAEGDSVAPGDYFEGFRVVVMVKGDYRQQYFNTRGLNDVAIARVRKQAYELEGMWLMEKNLARGERANKAKEVHRKGGTSAYITGVSGIKMKFTVDTKHRPVMGSKSKRKRKVRYYTPMFIVNTSYKGKRVMKHFNIKRYGFWEAWQMAVKFLCEQRHLNYERLVCRRPNVNQFTVIYRWQCSLGHTIPVERMPDEVLDDFEKDFMEDFMKGDLAY